MPRVSVLMSVFNGERFLVDAVASILGQTYTDFELIVVDDASTDGSLAIMNSVRDSRIRVLRQPANAGLANALNLAATHARGSLLARMDADDIAEPTRLAAQVAAMEKQPSLVILGTAYLVMNEQGHVLDRVVLGQQNTALQAGLLSGNQFCHPSVMLRAEAFRKVGGYRDIGGRYAQDYDLWLRLAELGELGNLAEPLLRYRVHGGQVSVAKGAEQRYTAELYKVLALQRRRTGSEDLAAARRSLTHGVGMLRLRSAQATDMIAWAATFEQHGDSQRARALRWRALRTAPWSRSVRGLLKRQLRIALRSLSGLKA